VLPLDPGYILIPEMIPVTPADLTTGDDTVVVTVTYHETPADDRMEADDGDSAKLPALLLQVSVSITVKRAQHALCLVSIMGVVVMVHVMMVSRLVIVLVAMIIVMVVMVTVFVVIHVLVTPMLIVTVVIMCVIVFIVVMELARLVTTSISSSMRWREYMSDVGTLVISIAVAVYGEHMVVALGVVETV